MPTARLQSQASQPRNRSPQAERSDASCRPPEIFFCAISGELDQARHAVTRRNAPTRAEPTVLPAKCAGKFVLFCRASDEFLDPSRNRLARGPQALLVEQAFFVGPLKVDPAGAKAIGACLGDESGSGINGA